MSEPDSTLHGSPAPGLFVTGTDTGVGKTVVTAALAGALRRLGVNAGVMKPVQTGAIRTGNGLTAPDGEFLRRASGVEDPPELVCPVMLEPPLAPWIAAELTGAEIDLELVFAAYRTLRERHPVVLVEGAGGLYVPIRRDYRMSDLARELALPLLVVARPSLGTLNHTLLTVESARAAGLEVAAVVLGNWPVEPGVTERTNLDALRRLLDVPIVEPFDADPEVDTEAGRAGRIVETMLRSPLPGLLMRSLGWDTAARQITSR